MTQKTQRLKELDSKRREAVFTAALNVFGRDGYRRAHTEEIAHRSGVSKGLLFYYFSNKQDLYLQTVEWLIARMERLIVDDAYMSIDDFFELILHLNDRSRAVFDKYPRCIDFSLALFYADASSSTGAWLAGWCERIAPRYFSHVRRERFREEGGMRRAIEMLIWLSDGWLHQHRLVDGPLDSQRLCDEIPAWCEMLRSWLYKEEFR